MTILSWLVTILVPLALIGLGLRVLLSPVFLKIEYSLPCFPPDDYGFTSNTLPAPLPPTSGK